MQKKLQPHSTISNYQQFEQLQLKKVYQRLHRCEEGGTHLRISVWHLLIYFKNNYLLKKLLKWINKKDLRILTFTKLYLKKQNK